jgi:toxin ParE1/3/4
VAQRVIWTETAWTDLENIADYIARDSPYYAAALVRQIRDRARSLNRLAMRGHVVPELEDKQIRELVIGSYRMIYRVEKSRVAVLAVVHGARDLRMLWSRRK